jgi:hypothetical protein
MWERYTEESRRVVFLSRHEAVQLGSTRIEPEHFLLGMIREGIGVVHRMFQAAGIDALHLRQDLVNRLVARPVINGIGVPFSASAERVLAYASEEADRLQDVEIASEHVLLGILREDESIPALVLGGAGLALEDARQRLAEARTPLAVNLELMKEDPQTVRQRLEASLEAVCASLRDLWAIRSARPIPAGATSLRTVSLGDTALFDLSIGTGVLENDVHTIVTGVPLFSVSVRSPLGFTSRASTADTAFGGVLWSIDDFDCRAAEAGERFDFTDDCGFIRLKTPAIDPTFLAYQVLQAGSDVGFSGECRASLKWMKDLNVELPVKEADGTFDIERMREWAACYAETVKIRERLDAESQVAVDASRVPPVIH